MLPRNLWVQKPFWGEKLTAACAGEGRDSAHKQEFVTNPFRFGLGSLGLWRTRDCVWSWGVEESKQHREGAYRQPDSCWSHYKQGARDHAASLTPRSGWTRRVLERTQCPTTAPARSQGRTTWGQHHSGDPRCGPADAPVTQSWTGPSSWVDICRGCTFCLDNRGQEVTKSLFLWLL